ncbi:MAG: hypothetical protein L0Z62_22160 [Gemmataceae bacterium]|nr:hypothetical protein [Gemmataceae bacterium]
MDEQEWAPRYQCPCCDYFSLGTRGDYEICEVCGWEDDASDLHRLDMLSPPNRMTLRETRHNFKQFGASNRNRVSRVLSAEERNAFRREPRKP